MARRGVKGKRTRSKRVIFTTADGKAVSFTPKSGRRKRAGGKRRRRDARGRFL